MLNQLCSDLVQFRVKMVVVGGATDYSQMYSVYQRGGGCLEEGAHTLQSQLTSGTTHTSKHGHQAVSKWTGSSRWRRQWSLFLGFRKRSSQTSGWRDADSARLYRQRLVWTLRCSWCCSLKWENGANASECSPVRHTQEGEPGPRLKSFVLWPINRAQKRVI